MPGSKHTVDFGQHLGPDRVGDKMTVVALAMQDPDGAQIYYLGKLGFTQSKEHPSRFNLPGTSGEQVEIVPVATLGAKSSIVLTTPDLDKSAAQLTRQQVAFQRASASATGTAGKTDTIDMISVTEPRQQHPPHPGRKVGSKLTPEGSYSIFPKLTADS